MYAFVKSDSSVSCQMASHQLCSQPKHALGICPGTCGHPYREKVKAKESIDFYLSNFTRLPIVSSSIKRVTGRNFFSRPCCAHNFLLCSYLRARHQGTCGHTLLFAILPCNASWYIIGQPLAKTLAKLVELPYLQKPILAIFGILPLFPLLRSADFGRRKAFGQLQGLRKQGIRLVLDMGGHKLLAQAEDFLSG